MSKKDKLQDDAMDKTDSIVPEDSKTDEDKAPQFITEVVDSPDTHAREEAETNPQSETPRDDDETVRGELQSAKTGAHDYSSHHATAQDDRSDESGTKHKLPEKEDELDPDFFGESKKKNGGGMLVPVLVGISLVLGTAAAYMSFKENQSQARIVSLNQKLEKAQGPNDNDILEKVMALAKLSRADSPMIVTVADSSKLKESASLFATATDGDKLIIAGKKVILYRPKDNKILVTGTVTFASQATNDSGATPSATLEKARFVLRNGTAINALTKKYEPTLKAAVKDAVIVARENAKKSDYEKSVIIDLTGQDDLAQTIAAQLEIEVGDLPEGEPKPTNADFLIILGTDAG